MGELTLHDYQLVGRDYLRSAARSGLFMDMGLGKTATALSALTPEHLPALVIAPKRVAETVWPPEAKLWRPDLRVALAAGRPDYRLSQLERPDVDVFVIGRDNAADVFTARPARPFRTLIIDELSGYKGMGRRWKDLRKFIRTSGVTNVWGLSGTPSPNGLGDLWPQIFLLDGGERLGKTVSGFRARYFYPGRRLPNGTITEWLPWPETEAALHQKLEDLCLSMATEGRITLPPVTYNDVELDLSSKVRATYRKFRKDLVVDIREFFGEGEQHTAANAAVLTSKLSQINAGFLFVDDADLRGMQYQVLHHDRPTTVREVVESTGSPVLVFYRYVPELEMLKAEFGDSAHEINEPGVIEAWNRGEVPVLLAHPQSAGHGLNLQHGGHTIVWSSLTWSLEEWDQGNKRLLRQGQKHPVVIHSLMTKGTVDQLMRARLEKKSGVQQRLLAYLESPL